MWMVCVFVDVHVDGVCVRGWCVCSWMYMWMVCVFVDVHVDGVCVRGWCVCSWMYMWSTGRAAGRSVHHQTFSNSQLCNYFE